MARFRGTLQGNRGDASRLGTPKSGITAKVNGWNAGIRVEARADGESDSFDIYITGGSNGGREIFLGTAKGGAFYPSIEGHSASIYHSASVEAAS